MGFEVSVGPKRIIRVVRMKFCLERLGAVARGVSP